MNEEELQGLNRLVDAYLSFAEIQAARRVPVRMREWQQKLDEYLKFASYEVLDNAGLVSHEQVMQKAQEEYEKFSQERIENYESDFDREVKRVLGEKKDGS